MAVTSKDIDEMGIGDLVELMIRNSLMLNHRADVRIYTYAKSVLNTRTSEVRDDKPRN